MKKEKRASWYLLTAIGIHTKTLSYYCSSPTQGNRMLWNGMSLAKRFNSISEARKKIPKMKQIYLGLTNWKAMKVKEDL